MAVHAYDGVTYCSAGSTDAACDGLTIPTGQTCLVPGNELAAFPGTVTLQDYIGAQKAAYDEPVEGSGDWVARQLPVQTFTVPLPSTGYVYLNIHLDYGLKDATADADEDGNPDRYTKDSNNNALLVGDYDITIPTNATHPFEFVAVDGGESSDGDSVRNLNTFKKNVGVGGLVTAGDTPEVVAPVDGASVTLFDPNGAMVDSVGTDEDGYYQLVHKHKGKRADYTVQVQMGPDVLPGTVSLKANGYEMLDFFFDTSE